MGIYQSKHLSNKDLCKQKHMRLKNGDRKIQICVVERNKLWSCKRDDFDKVLFGKIIYQRLWINIHILAASLHKVMIFPLNQVWTYSLWKQKLYTKNKGIYFVEQILF